MTKSLQLFTAIALIIMLCLRAHSQQPPINLTGKWRWEGTEKRVELTQIGTTITGKVHPKSGPDRELLGKILPSGEVELYEYVSRGETNIPSKVWNSVLLETEHPRRPGLVPIMLKLSYFPSNDKLEGVRSTFEVEYTRSTEKFEKLKNETASIRFVRLAGICGPDVTDQTLEVLKQIITNFRDAKSDDQKGACSRSVSFIDGLDVGPWRLPLVGLEVPGLIIKTTNMKADYAWDILELFQEPGAFPKGNYPGEPSSWESLTGSSCCTPRYPCGKSVQFFGTCHDQQVVNYVMWGVMTSLCSIKWGINTQQEAFAYLRNKSGPNWTDQQTMSEVGEEYTKVIQAYLANAKKYEDLRRTYTDLIRRRSLGTAKQSDIDTFMNSIPANERGTTLKIITGFSGEADMVKSANFPELRAIVERGDKGSNRPYKTCDTTCNEKLTSGQASAIQNRRLRYRWMPFHNPQGTTDAR